MNTIFMLTLQQTATQGNAFMQFLPLILIVVVFWFFMIRPQMKRQKELKKYRDELKKGDKVMTTGGIFGKIVEINDFTVIIEVAVKEGGVVDTRTNVRTELTLRVAKVPLRHQRRW